MPYYATNGSALSATSTFQILVDGTASTTNLIVTNSFTLGTLSGFLKATAGALATALINLASDVTGILPIRNGGTGTSTAPVYGQVLVGNSNGTYTLTATSSLGIGGGSSAWGGITGVLSSQTDIQNALNAKLSFTSWYATTSAPQLTTLAGLAITKSQVSDFGTYESPLTFSYPLSRSTNAISLLLSTSTSNTWGGTQTFTNIIAGNINGNAATVTNGMYTTDTGTVTNTMLAGSIANNKLSNSSITVNGTSISLGGLGTITSASSTLLANSNTWTSTQGMNISGNAGTVTNGVYTTTFSNLFDTRLTSTTTLPGLTTLAGLAITKSQVSDFGTYQSSLGSGTPGQVLAYLNGTPSWTATTTYSTGLAYANGAVTNTGVISNAGDWAGTWQTFAPSHFLTSLAGAASSTLLSDSNSFSGSNKFTNPITSTITTGTAPIILASVTKVANLNADLLDGFDSSAFGDATAANQTTILTRIGVNTDATTTPSAASSLWAGMKFIAGNMKTNVTAMSAETAATYMHANAAKYCYDLSAAAAVAMDGNTTTVYTDWRLPTVGEASVFEGTITSANYIWTATVRDATINTWINLKLSDGLWSSDTSNVSTYVRCVR